MREEVVSGCSQGLQRGAVARPLVVRKGFVVEGAGKQCWPQRYPGIPRKEDSEGPEVGRGALLMEALIIHQLGSFGAVVMQMSHSNRDGRTALNILKAISLYTFNGQIVWIMIVSQ